MSDWLDKVHWNSDGLVPVITQEHSSKQVLTLAWMNKESLRLTAESGHAVYWSVQDKSSGIKVNSPAINNV